MNRNSFTMVIATAITLSVLAACEKRTPTNPVSSVSSEYGEIVLTVTVAPWHPVALKSAAVQAMDSVKVFVYNTSNAKITEQRLTKNESRWQGSVPVPPQNNMRVVLGYFGGAAVRYLGETTGVNVAAGGTTNVDVTVNYMGLSVAAPDSAGEDFPVLWTSRPFSTGYQLQQDTKSDFSTATQVYSGTDTTYTVPISGKTHGQVYYYRVCVTTAYGNGPWYSKGGASTTGNLPGTIIIDAPDLPDEAGGVEVIQGITLASIPGGTFSMGSNDGESDEKPVHTVTVTGFEMSIYEITQGQYQSIIGSNPSSFTGDDNLPVELVSWWDAIKFCNALSAKAGFDKCYNENTGACDFTKNGFRLSTEAEWEYACRAGTTTAYYTGNSESDLASAGWYEGNSSSKTHKVGQKTANTFGLYDMHGNVWEWCNDWYGSYSSGSVTDPTGAQTGADRVIRGGCWFSYAGYCRSAKRGIGNPVYSDFYMGFRVVRRP